MNELAKIHIAAKDLGLSKQAYRDIISLNFPGKDSSKDLTALERIKLLALLQAKGWRPKYNVKDGRRPVRKKSASFIEIKPGPYAKQQKKVLGMWVELGYDVAKLHARCKRQWKIDRFEWLLDYEALHILITDLEARKVAAGIKG